VPGKPVVNSISLKEARRLLKKAPLCRYAGGAVMAFDEKGQRTPSSEGVDLSAPYRLLTERAIYPTDITDPNILATRPPRGATTMVNFIEATRIINDAPCEDQ
jgi:cobalamin-dependent methionine synthase I